MKVRFLLTLISLYICINLFAIGDGLYNEQLLQYLQQNYTPATTMGYNNARDVLYSIIDIQPGNQLSGIYSGYTITLDPELDPSTDAYQKGINCEHSYPQSMGASQEPQRSNMHYLFPCKSNVNSSRGNHPYGEIPDQDTDNWYYNDIVLHTIPTSNIDKYAEKENDGIDRFEPREVKKGDAARAIFYFFTIYNDAANSEFFHQQKDVLLQWHYQDPVDEDEIERTWQIAEYQHNLPNPFVIDETLAERIWFYLSTPEITNIEIRNNSIQINWTQIDGATSYTIYSSSKPNAIFPDEWNILETEIISTQKNFEISDDKLFYRIRAIQ